MTTQTDTGVVALRDDAEARAELICSELDTLAQNLENAAELVVQAWMARDYLTLGYGSWDEYVHARFGAHLLKLPRAVRRQWEHGLKDAGLTTREIASVVNVNQSTVSRDLADANASSQAGDPDNAIIDGEVLSDTGEPSEALAELRTMVDQAHRAIGYLANLGTLPEDLPAGQARAWRDLFAGTRGKGNAGLAKKLHSFADKLSEAYSLK